SNSKGPPPRTLTFGAATVAGLVFLLAAWAGPQIAQKPDTPATLKLSVLDEATHQHLPARVEFLDKDGKPAVAEDALRSTGGEGIDPPAPWQGTLEKALSTWTRKFANGNTGTVQFYTGGTCKLSVPAGDYRLRVFRGL